MTTSRRTTRKTGTRRKAEPGSRTDTARRDVTGATQLSERPDGELRLERGLERSGRVGDPANDDQMRDTYPPSRVREAGQTGGEMPDGESTADDVTPETMLDSEPSHTPHSGRGRMPADMQMRTVNEAGVGGGDGPDEAELAERDPVGVDEARARQRKAARHAADPNAFEPHEAEEQAAAQRERGGEES
jgi:hypothetical protein